MLKAIYFPEASKRCDFRSLVESDIAPWTEFFKDNPNLAFLGLTHAESTTNNNYKDWSKMWINKQFERYQESGYGMLAVIDKTSKQLIGQAGISQKLVDNNIEHEIAYSFLPKYWHKGYASEVSAKMVECAIKEKVNQQIISIIHIDNIGSEKVAIKNGMSILRQSEYLGMPVNIFARSIG